MIFKKDIKQKRKSKTIWFGFLIMIFGALHQNFPFLQGILSQKTYGISLMVIGISIQILRYFTEEPIK